MLLALEDLEPEHVGLYAGRHATRAERLGDKIMGVLAVGIAFLEDVDDVVLETVASKRDNLVCVMYVADIVFVHCPVCEIESFPEFTESPPG